MIGVEISFADWGGGVVIWPSGVWRLVYVDSIHFFDQEEEKVFRERMSGRD